MKSLLPHQTEDAAFLAARRFAGNFSGMGSGKTLSALAAVGLVMPAVTIVVCPPIAMDMWKREAEDFLSVEAQILKTGKTRIDLSMRTVLIMSYAIATKRVEELKKIRAGVLILDESHACKSIKAQRTKALIGGAGLAQTVDHTWCLTGTPSTRWNDDLFSFLINADKHRLQDKIGSLTMERFQLRYCVTQKKKFSRFQRYPTVVTVGNRNTEELHDMLFNGNPIAVRRELKEVWEQMPPLTTNRLMVKLDMSAELKAMLDEIKNQSVAQISQQIQNDGPALATLRRELGMAKVKASVSEIVDRCEAGAGPLLIGAWHTSVIDALAIALTKKELKVGILDGRTPANKRQALQDAFNGGELDVLVGQIAAMGVAIDLQHGGNRIICIEEDWSPAVQAQFYARMHRMGQTKHVHVDIFASDTKLDKAVARIAGTKAREHHKILEQDL